MADSKGVLRFSLDELLRKATAIQDQLYRLRRLVRSSTLPWKQLLQDLQAIERNIEVLTMLLQRREHPELHNLVVVPKALSTEVDDHLKIITSGLLQSFTHDKAPELLRTKADPQLEAELEDAYDASAALSSSSPAAPSAARMGPSGHTTTTTQQSPEETLTSLDHTCSHVLDFLSSQKKQVELRVKR